jgi:hypothetical protein
MEIDLLAIIALVQNRVAIDQRKYKKFKRNMGSCASVDDGLPPKPADGKAPTSDQKTENPQTKRGPRRSIIVVKNIVRGWGGTQAQSLREIAPPKLKKPADQNAPNMKFLKKTRAAARRSIDYARSLMNKNTNLLTVEEEAKCGDIEQDAIQNTHALSTRRDDVYPPRQPDSSFRQAQRSARRFRTPANESEAISWIHDSLEATPRRRPARTQPPFRTTPRGADAAQHSSRRVPGPGADAAAQHSSRRAPGADADAAGQHSSRRAPSGGAAAPRPAPQSELEAAAYLHRLLHAPPSARARSPRDAAAAAGRGRYAPPRAAGPRRAMDSAAAAGSRRNF